MRSLQVLVRTTTVPFTGTTALTGEYTVAVTEQVLPHRTSLLLLLFFYVFLALSEVILSMSFG